MIVENPETFFGNLDNRGAPANTDPQIATVVITEDPSDSKEDRVLPAWPLRSSAGINAGNIRWKEFFFFFAISIKKIVPEALFGIGEGDSPLCQFVLHTLQHTVQNRIGIDS
jgi:hypothetical protein